MPNQVAMNAVLQCSFGAAPASLLVLPTNRVMAEGPPAATIMDHLPMVNITPFGACNSPSSPLVIAATAAAMGVMTPVPCLPVTTAPWMVGSPTVVIGGIPALNDPAKCLCSMGGMIDVKFPATLKTHIP